MNETDARRLIVRLGQEVADQPAPLPTLMYNARQARRRQRRSRMLVTLGAAGAVVVGVTALIWGPLVQSDGQAVAPAAPFVDRSTPSPPNPCGDRLRVAPEFNEPLPTEPPFPTNASGETYGSDAGAKSLRDSPDLVAVAGDCGVAGYVKAKDLNGPRPTSPADALRLQRGNELSPPVLPVYLSDGMTQVDTFTLSVGVGSSAARPAAE